MNTHEEGLRPPTTPTGVTSPAPRNLAEAEVLLSEAEACQLYAGSDAAHDFDHILRVTHLGEQIARAEQADVVVVRLAALLHDVPVSDAEHNPDTRRKHHLAAADFARQFLTARGLGTERVANVVHCIEAHRFRDQSIQPVTLEAQCLYDADKLDSIGAIGVVRAFAYAGRYGSRLWTTSLRSIPTHEHRPTGADYTPVHEFVYKLQQLMATLHTNTARRIGRQRHAFMVDFFDQLEAEMQPLAE
ncbi:MAG: HD domain-containing protein [Chloroflexi bacterium]|nr:HD domain-containing protein [Chloroflexota bacterium]